MLAVGHDTGPRPAGRCDRCHRARLSRAVATHAGLVPRHRESGTSVRVHP
ncbi:MAG: transposase [Bacteroidetes bacterium]|nr:transposase [Bacteroidota bacterium]